MSRLRTQPSLSTPGPDDAGPPRPEELLERLPLSHSLTLPVLGIAVRFSSNSTEALDAVEESFGVWRGVVRSPARGNPPVAVRLIIVQNDERVQGRVPLTWHVPDIRRMVVQSPGSVGMIDLDRGDVFAYVSPGLLADRAHFRYGLLEALTLMAVNGRGRYPVHAAALVRRRAVVLLAGPSGTGKSTLAYAAMDAGYGVLSDDAVYLEPPPDFRIWGIPGRLYLRPESRKHFPGLSGLEPTVLASEKTKIVVAVDRARTPRPRVRADRAGVVLLERGDKPASIEHVTARVVESALTADLRMSLARYGSSMRDTIRRLTAPGGWRITLSSDPAEALPLLQGVFDELDRRKPTTRRTRSR